MRKKKPDPGVAAGTVKGAKASKPAGFGRMGPNVAKGVAALPAMGQSLSENREIVTSLVGA
jgi:hypothetical protein